MHHANEGGEGVPQPVHWLGSPAEVDGRDRFPTVAKFSTDHGARFYIERALFSSELLRRWSALGWTGKTREYFEATLRVSVAQTVQF